MNNTLSLLNSYTEGYISKMEAYYALHEMELPSENKLREKALESFLTNMYKDKLITILSSAKSKSKDLTNTMALYYASNKFFYAHLARAMTIIGGYYINIINILNIAINCKADPSVVIGIILSLAGLYEDNIIGNKNIIKKLEESLKEIGKLPK